MKLQLYSNYAPLLVFEIQTRQAPHIPKWMGAVYPFENIS